MKKPHDHTEENGNGNDDDEEVYVFVLRRKKHDAGKKLNIHHIEPTSRGGDDEKENLCVWPSAFHRRWHDLFTNLTLLEIHVFIDMLHEPGKIWTRQLLHETREKIVNGEIPVS